MRAAIYCRVSTEEQAIEGSSLQSQLEACLKHCKDKGYEVNEANIFSETYSGLSLERPKLDTLREKIRAKEVEAVVCYTLDRLSRNPNHIIILQEECERAGVQLALVTETLDSSDLGRLITYIKGFSAKLEAEKIRERTMRGKKTRVEKEGKLPCGRGILYGYSYDKEKGINLANGDLDTVRTVGLWLIEEGISLNETCRRMMEKGIPAPKGGTRWSRGTIGRIMRNATYAGKSYAFKTVLKGKSRVQRALNEQVEIPNAVDRVAFTWDEWRMIQQQLDRNRELSPRNQKFDYLLRSLVYCRHCGRKYYGVPLHDKPYYRCSGHIKLLSDKHCANKTVNARWLEEAVWAEVDKVLHNKSGVIATLEKQRNSEEDIARLAEERLKLNDSQLRVLDEAETRYLRLYGAGITSSEKLELECSRVKQERAHIIEDCESLKRQLADSNAVTTTEESIKRLRGMIDSNLDTLDQNKKRLILHILQVKIWIDGNSAPMLEGVLPFPEEVNTVSQPL